MGPCPLYPPAVSPFANCRCSIWQFHEQVRLHIDAEQTYMQPAIDHLATKMQRAYNTQFPTVFNSYQCYLDIARNRIDNDLERSQREGWIFAAKLCRGVPWLVLPPATPILLNLGVVSRVISVAKDSAH